MAEVQLGVFASALCFSSSIYVAMNLASRPGKLTGYGASSCPETPSAAAGVAAGAVALVMVGCGINEAGAPAIAVAVTNTAIAHHDYESGTRCRPEMHGLDIDG